MASLLQARRKLGGGEVGFMPTGTEDGSLVLGFRQLLSAYSDMISLGAILFRVGGLGGSWDEFDLEPKQVS